MLQAYAKAGVRVNDPDKVFDPSEGVRQKVSGGFILPSTAAAKASVKHESGSSEEGLSAGKGPLKKDIGITKYKRHKKTQTKGDPQTTKIGQIKTQKELEALVMESIKNNPDFKNKKITNIKLHRGRLAAEVDGVLMYMEP